MNSSPAPLPPRPARPIAEQRPIGGRLCLDFVNTLAWRGDDRPNERLTSYDDLVTWGLRAGTLKAKDAKALRGHAVAQPAAAEVVFARARDLREALHRLFTGSGDSGGGAGHQDDLAALNAELAGAPGRGRLTRRDGGFAWDEAWDEEGRDPGLDCLIWPVVWSAADLLAAPAARGASEPAGGRIKACADAACGALFYDDSRNRSRRWCVMEDCGNRAKARRHYERHRQRNTRGVRPVA